MKSKVQHHNKNSFEVSKKSLMECIETERCETISSGWLEEDNVEVSIVKVTDGIGDKKPVYAKVVTKKEVSKGDFVETTEVTSIGRGFTIYGQVQPRDGRGGNVPSLEAEGTVDIKDSNNFLVEKKVSDQVLKACLEEYEKVVMSGDSKNDKVEGFNGSIGKGFVVSVEVEDVEETFNSQFKELVKNSHNGDEIEEYYDGVDKSFEEILREIFEVEDGIVKLTGQVDVSSLMNDWEIMSIAFQHKGVFKNQSLIATVKAMDEYGNFETQTEMADEIGIDKSNISRAVQDVKEWEKRLEWSCKNC